MPIVEQRNPDGSVITIQQDATGKEISRQQTQSSLLQREVQAQKLVRSGVSPDAAAQIASGSANPRDYVDSSGKPIIKENVTLTDTQISEATKSPKYLATTPGGVTQAITAKQYTQLQSEQRAEQEQARMMAQNKNYQKVSGTYQQYKDRFPEQASAEAHGLAYTASDIRLNRSFSDDDTKKIVYEGREQARWSKPHEWFEERLPEANLERNILTNQPKNNNIPKNPDKSNITSDIQPQDSIISWNLKSLKKWSSNVSDKIARFSDYSRERSRETNVIGKVGWGLAGAAIAPLVQIPFFVAGNSEYLVPAIKQTIRHPITTLKEMGGSMAGDVASDPVYTLSGYAGMAVAPKVVKASFGDRITGVFKKDFFVEAATIEPLTTSKIPTLPKIKITAPKGYEVKNLVEVKVPNTPKGTTYGKPSPYIQTFVDTAPRGKGIGVARIAEYHQPTTFGIKNPTHSYKPIKAMSGLEIKAQKLGAKHEGNILGNVETSVLKDVADMTIKRKGSVTDTYILAQQFGAMPKASTYRGIGVIVGSKGYPIAGLMNKKLTFGTPKMDVSRFQGGYVPEGALETAIVRKNMARSGFSPTEIEKVDVGRQIMGFSEKQSSKFMEKEFIRETKTLTPKGVDALIKYTKKNIKDVDELYGSFVARGQTKPEYRRVAGDIDIQLKTGEVRAKEFVKGLEKHLKSKGEKVRISKDKPTLIESMDKKGKYHHAVDVHFRGEPSPDLLNPVKEGAYGFRFGQKPIKIEGLPAMSLSEQVLRKGASSLSFQKGKKIMPAAHRLKDVPDLYAGGKTLTASARKEYLSFLKQGKIKQAEANLKRWKELYPEIDWKIALDTSTVQRVSLLSSKTPQKQSTPLRSVPIQQQRKEIMFYSQRISSSPSRLGSSTSRGMSKTTFRSIPTSLSPSKSVRSSRSVRLKRSPLRSVSTSSRSVGSSKPISQSSSVTRSVSQSRSPSPSKAKSRYVSRSPTLQERAMLSRARYTYSKPGVMFQKRIVRIVRPTTKPLKSVTAYRVLPDLLSRGLSEQKFGKASKPIVTKKVIDEYKQYLGGKQRFFKTREQRGKVKPTVTLFKKKKRG